MLGAYAWSVCEYVQVECACQGCYLTAWAYEYTDVEHCEECLGFGCDEGKEGKHGSENKCVE